MLPDVFSLGICGTYASYAMCICVLLLFAFLNESRIIGLRVFFQMEVKDYFLLCKWLQADWVGKGL